MGCKGICDRYVASKPIDSHSRYREGQKRCSMCGIFMTWEGKHCPCCGFILRTKPRGVLPKYRESNPTKRI